MPSSYILFHAVDEKRLAVFRKILMNHGSIKNVGGQALFPAPFLRKKDEHRDKNPLQMSII